MLIHSIALKNFLSFGDEFVTVPLNALNVIIGPNGSGKSNFLEAIELIKAAPKDFLTPIRDGGGVRDWLWKGSNRLPIASVSAEIDYPKGPVNLRYGFTFTEEASRFEIIDEHIWRAAPDGQYVEAYLYYELQNGCSTLDVKGDKRRFERQEIDTSQSILAQLKDPDQYPELTYLGNVFSKIRLYREWGFGRYTVARIPQKADMRNDMLESDSSNLGLVLNFLRRDPSAKKRVLEALQVLYEGIDDFDVQIQGGTVQVFLQEGRFTVPATRLSDGTLRYLSLLAILCHPNPPPLVCIEEPEIGLHPDILPTLAKLLKEASQRCQIIVTTHSDVLVDAMTDCPEAVLVAEKYGASTMIKRLNAEELKPWLEKYRLGQLWSRGEIGGNRW